jgi:hypothetical protein
MRTLIICAAALCLAAASAPAQSACSVHTVRGDWGVTCDGNLTPGPNAPLTPVRILGTCTAGFDGVFTCEATMSLGGAILAQTMVGKAVVNENCTGTIRYTQTVNGAPAPDMNIRYLILDSGKTIKGLPVDPGSNLACTLVRM